jgi:hypothetical protein
MASLVMQPSCCHLAFDADGVQAERRRKPTNTRSND